MKKALLLTVAIMCAATVAFGQAGTIGLYADAAGADCHIPDTVAGLYTVYAVHTNTAGATASQWAAPLPSCYLGIWLSDTPVYAVTIGNSQSGVAIGYGVCLAGPIHVLSISLFNQALTGSCCAWTVIPDPNVPSGQIEVVDCVNALLYGTGFTSYINGNINDCPCTVGTEETTWGAVKSIYSE
jgi:hypothetical protein